jgi:dethiobiotin synthetase
VLSLLNGNILIYSGLVVTGTGTGVGKTKVACGLCVLFRETGFRLGVLKPVETGCEGEKLIPADGMDLAKAAGLNLEDDCKNSKISIDDVVPWRFPDPLAPEEAARITGQVISVDRIYQAMDRWAGRAEFVIVETAGGLMVPLNEMFGFADLIQGLELPVVIAAGNELGVINHTLLTIEALRKRNLTPIAVVLNQISPGPDQSAASNAPAIRQHGGVAVYEVPYSSDDPVGAVAKALSPHMKEIRRLVEDDFRKTLNRYVNKK